VSGLTHAPAQQSVEPLGHALPQPLQLNGSLVVSMHSLLQQVSEPGHSLPAATSQPGTQVPALLHSLSAGQSLLLAHWTQTWRVGSQIVSIAGLPPSVPASWAHSVFDLQPGLHVSVLPSQ